MLPTKSVNIYGLQMYHNLPDLTKYFYTYFPKNIRYNKIYQTINLKKNSYFQLYEKKQYFYR